MRWRSWSLVVNSLIRVKPAARRGTGNLSPRQAAFFLNVSQSQAGLDVRDAIHDAFGRYSPEGNDSFRPVTRDGALRAFQLSRQLWRCYRLFAAVGHPAKRGDRRNESDRLR